MIIKRSKVEIFRTILLIYLFLPVLFSPFFFTIYLLLNENAILSIGIMVMVLLVIIIFYVTSVHQITITKQNIHLLEQNLYGKTESSIDISSIKSIEFRVAKRNLFMKNDNKFELTDNIVRTNVPSSLLVVSKEGSLIRFPRISYDSILNGLMKTALKDKLNVSKYQMSHLNQQTMLILLGLVFHVMLIVVFWHFANLSQV